MGQKASEKVTLDEKGQPRALVLDSQTLVQVCSVRNSWEQSQSLATDFATLRLSFLTYEKGITVPTT